MSVANVTLADLVARARALAPQLAANAAATEAARMVPAANMQALFDNGLMRACQPARFGGYALDVDAPVAIGRALARACPSTAWMVSIVGPHAAWTGRFPRQAQDEVWDGYPDQLIAGAQVARGGTIRRSGDGFRVDGAFGFASGIDHARWGFVIGAVEGEKGAVSCLIPRADWTIDDTWFVAGMKGSGSKDMHVHDAFVPAHRAVPMRSLLGEKPPGAADNPEALFRRDYPSFIGATLLGPILGAAEGALDAYVAATRTRAGVMFGDKPAESPTVLLRFAESAAEVRAAGVLADNQIRALADWSRGEGPLDDERRVTFARDRAYIARLCLGAVERLAKQMGATGLADSNPVQRFHRDLFAMAQQIGVNWDRNLLPYARWAFGDAEAARSNWRQ